MRNEFMLVAATAVIFGFAHQPTLADDASDARQFLQVTTHKQGDVQSLVGVSQSQPATVCMHAGDIAIATISFNIYIADPAFADAGLVWAPLVTGGEKPLASLQRNHMPVAKKWVPLSTTEYFEVPDDAKTAYYLFSAGFTPPEKQRSKTYSISNVSVVVTRYGLNRDCQPAAGD